MKKKLEAELISIAHRILKLKNRGDIEQLQQETLKLYEKLSVLKFVEDNFSDIKPTIGYASAEGKLEEIYGQEEQPAEPEKEETTQAAEKVAEQPVEEHEAEPVKDEEAGQETEEKQEETSEPEQEVQAEAEEEPEPAEENVYTPEEDAKPEPVAEEKPSFDIDFESAEEKKEMPKPQKEISFEDFHDYKEPEFVKKDNDAPAPAAVEDDWRNWEPKKEEPEQPAAVAKEEEKETPAQDYFKPEKKSLNDALGKSINLGLNDRIAFEKHLFGGSGEDLNRVLSQLNTFDTYQEARDFVDDLVKPDYNNWEGKEEYEERFMALVEKKFD